ncbi:uncharacterized protein LOC108683283 [Hyalella azteca]|uniref:Uncharacterized protein LOC108683283 n=1 Tax=Hyalella azteca TaxID=294128 RepID=A0A8B7PPE2_HYAAZ|nr:uncharacterized protein LOC108683283 [Hyalella azteca]
MSDLGLNDDDDEYVDVIEDFSYTYQGRNHRIYRNERYLVLQKRTDWWQIVDTNKKVIWAPKSYLRLAKITTQQKKDTLKAKFQRSPEVAAGLGSSSNSPALDAEQARLLAWLKQDLAQDYQRSLHQKQYTESESLQSNRQSLKKKEGRYSKKDISHPVPNTYTLPHVEIKDTEDSSNYQNRKKPQKITKEDISRPILFSHFPNSLQQTPALVPGCRESQSNASSISDYNRNPVDAFLTHSNGGSGKSSRLSLCEGSVCSSDSLDDIIEESDTLCSGRFSTIEHVNSEYSSRNVKSGKASSDEQLDSPPSFIDHMLNNSLSSRNRSNSVDFKSLSRDRFYADANDNVKKSIKATDDERVLRRRSLVMDEIRPQNSSYPRTVTDDIDVSHWIDSPPPSLPPKKNKSKVNKSNLLSDTSNQEIMRHLQPLNQHVPQPETHGDLVKDGTYDGSNYRSEHFAYGQEPLPLLQDSKMLSFVGNQAGQFNVKEQYPASLEHSSRNSAALTGGSACRIALTKTLSQEDEPGSQKPPLTNTMSRSYTCIGTFSNSEHNKHNPAAGIINRGDDFKRSFKEKSEASKRKGSIRNFFSRGTSKQADPKRRESVPHPNQDVAVKVPQCPPSPSPKHKPLRELHDEWVEYWSPEDNCSFYYNRTTKEHRRKPPRKVQQKHEHSNNDLQADVGERPNGGGAPVLGNFITDTMAPNHDYWGQRSLTPSSMTSSGSSYVEPLLVPQAFQQSQHLRPPQPSSIDSISSSASSGGNHASSDLSRGHAEASNSKAHLMPQTNQNLNLLSAQHHCNGACHDRTMTGNDPGATEDQISAPNLSGDTPSYVWQSLPAQQHQHSPALPPRPPHGAKPTSSADPSDTINETDCVREALADVHIPSCYEREEDDVLFTNKITGEKWQAYSTTDGRIYYNNENHGSTWTLPDTSSHHQDRVPAGDEARLQDNQEAPPESPITPGCPGDSGVLHLKEGWLQRTLYSREHKKVRKNWTSSYVILALRSPEDGMFLPSTQAGGDSPPLARYFFIFAKNPDGKKASLREHFELLEPVKIALGDDKNKSSKINVLSLTNAAGTELLLRSDELSVIQDWHAPRKSRRSDNKVAAEGEFDGLSSEQRTIRTKLLDFIKRRPPAEVLTKKGIIRDSVFGNSIAELCRQEKTKVPLFVLLCIKAIENKECNLKTDGLYRISGNAARIQRIRYEVAKNNYEVLNEEKDVYNLSGALKLFFRELREPLVPFNAYDAFINWSNTLQRGGRHLDELQAATKKMPVENLETLKLLLRHLKRVCEHSAHNRMSPKNLAIVFGPCLMWPPESTAGRDLMLEAMVHNVVVEGLLMHFE